MWTRTWIALLVAGTLMAHGPEAAEKAKAEAPDRAALVNGTSQFALDLYGQLRKRDGNVFYSPYSISGALAMTSAGARGATLEQMSRTLRFPTPGDRLHEAFAGVSRDVAAGGKSGTELFIANALWTQSGLSIRPEFRSTVTQTYGAGLTPLDFVRTPEKARLAINDWAERETRDRIKNLVPEGVITPDTRVVLTNAIYFKGAWKRPFDPKATQPDTFTLATGQRLGDVPFMIQRAAFRSAETNGLQVLDLPYGSGEQSMIVFLPARADGLAELEKTLTAARVTELMSQMTDGDVIVGLPRFKVTAEFRLKEALRGLGMTLPFDFGRADFSGITRLPRLVLDEVVHKAYVEVNEKGTEAAAATAAVVVAASARRERVFRADRPFFFLIRDNATGSILFAGRLMDPRGN
jgi:serpin B